MDEQCKIMKGSIMGIRDVSMDVMETNKWHWVWVVKIKLSGYEMYLVCKLPGI